MVVRAVFIRDGFNYDVDEASFDAGLDTSFDQETGEELPSLTEQSHADECDINTIVRRFGLTGQMPEPRMPLSGDFSGINDYHTALNMVREADEAFMELPADMRARFENDPGRLMSFLDEDKNRDEAVKLGLVSPPPEKTRDAVQAIDELRDVLTTKPAV